MNFTATRGLGIFHQLQNLKFIYSRTFHSAIQPVEHFSRFSATFASLCCPQCSKKPCLTLTIASLFSSRTIRTSSLTRACSNFNDAFTENNKMRLVKQLGGMKTRKSLLSSCSEEAAVFVPFCLVDSVPSVLFTLRSNQLNKHRGEVSFPGGKKDPEDESIIETAVREMEEELGLEKNYVQVWAQMPAMPDRLGKIAITPIIGFIGEIDVNSLALNPEEVASVFTLSLDHLCSPKNQRYTKHKHLGVESVFTLSLEHVCNPTNCGYTKFTSQAVLPLFLNGPRRIWGLTAIVLEQALLALVPENYPQQLFRPGKRKLPVASKNEKSTK